MNKYTSIPKNWTPAQDLAAFADHLGIPEVLWTLLLDRISTEYGRLDTSVTQVLDFLIRQHPELGKYGIPVGQISFAEKLAWIEDAAARVGCSDVEIKKLTSVLDLCRSLEAERIRLKVLYAATPVDKRWFFPFVNLHKQIGSAAAKLSRAIKVPYPEFPRTSLIRQLRGVLGGDED